MTWQTRLRAGSDDLDGHEARIDYDTDTDQWRAIIDGDRVIAGDTITAYPLIADGVDPETHNGARLVAESIIDDLLDSGEDDVPADAIGLHHVAAESIMVSFSATQGPTPDDEWDALQDAAEQGSLTAELHLR